MRSNGGYYSFNKTFMTNREKLNQVNKQLDNWENLGLLEHFDLLFNQLPAAIVGANHRPNDEWQKEESDFEKGLTDEHDYGNI